ncbi:MAG: hypothetical protein Q9162_007626 [Coniocarpon cinnabarinum]
MSTKAVDDQPPILVQSRDHRQLLDAIDDLRSQGINQYVPLPQLIVCGDQSSGKSSVLEAVSGIRFPTKDNLCTRFATEVVMRRSLDVKISVGISPAANRAPQERGRLAHFKYADAAIDKLPDIVEKAKETMGVGTDAKSFTEDVLRIELSGPNQAQLTLVDLPGLIQSESKQQTIADVQLVNDLVQSYMSNPRSVILAVVSAKNDYANQSVTRLAHEYDPRGMRTLGIVTKPDTLHVGSESERGFIDLVKNDAMGFRLGWHVMKNRDWPDRECSMEERHAAERLFFAEGAWSLLDSSCLGVASLKPRLSTILRDQIISELPSLIHDVEAGIEDSQSSLGRLGDARQTVQQQRSFLVNASQSFSRLIQASVDGVYSDDFFGDAKTEIGYSKRLRAVVQNKLQQFSDDIATEGHRWEIIEDNLDERSTHPQQIKRSRYLNEVKKMMERSRGRELPGLFNPLIIGDLFYEQSEPWKGLVDTYSIAIQEAVRVCVDLTLRYVTDENTYDGLNRTIIAPAMEGYVEKLGGKVEEIMVPHQKGHPITYNHRFTETIKKTRRDHNRTKMSGILQSFFGVSSPGSISPGTFDLERLLKKISGTDDQDMERLACSEAADCMEAYYEVCMSSTQFVFYTQRLCINRSDTAINYFQVAMRALIDNFATLVIESYLLKTSVDILLPGIVMKLSDEAVQDIAAESEESQTQRTRLNTKLENLKGSLHVLQVLARNRADNKIHRNDQLEDSVSLNQETDGANDRVQMLEELEIKTQPADNGRNSEPDGVLTASTKRKKDSSTHKLGQDIDYTFWK